MSSQEQIVRYRPALNALARTTEFAALSGEAKLLAAEIVAGCLTYRTVYVSLGSLRAICRDYAWKRDEAARAIAELEHHLGRLGWRLDRKTLHILVPEKQLDEQALRQLQDDRLLHLVQPREG